MPPSVESGLTRYRLIRLLGRGGLGEVYLAHDSKLNRQVAIKFVAPERLGDDEGRRRLLHEARTAAALDHASICTVYEADRTPDGRAFIAMQYIEGEPLSALLQRGPMRPRDALALCSHIADGLAAAHRKGIIHRDLKPANVMVTPSGLPKLVDFGIAKVMMAAAAAGDASTITDTIESHHLVGTPAYMSPEQVLQEPLDGRSDLFSLGAVLFECLTGRRAFSGRTPHETTGQILNVYPPAPSSLQPAVTAEEDELCRRLLAKHPADRFQSADEVVGAIRLLLHDTSRMAETPLPRPRRWVPWVAIAAIVAMAGVAAVMWKAPALPAAPPDAQRWYRSGTEAIREGAYASGRKQLLQAVGVYPQYALAYARLAEADAELDDGRAAKDHLLQLSRLSPDEAGLPPIERLRLAAVRALVMRDVDASVQLYGQLLAKNRDDPGAWLDLGRAQETAGLRSAARESYEGALARDRQYAAAYLRLGALHGSESRHEEALAAFQEAERLYRARSDIEGETEVLLRRGALARVGEPKAARVDLERALALASDAKNLYQEVRARLALSSVTASEGRFAEAEKTATAAVNQALASGLDTVAAEGLIDLAATLMQAGPHYDEAEQQAQRAISLADRQEARLTAARARIALASIYFEADRFKESLAALGGVLPFLKENRYRRHELTAVSIAARSHQSLDDLDVARQMSSDVLATAETVKDDVQIAIAAGNLASVMASLGQLPEALRLRQRAQGIRQRLGNHADLPYDLTNAADLLIRLGRDGEADVLLRQLDAGIAAGIDSYQGRAARVTFLRAFEEATTLRCDASLRRLDVLVKTSLTGSAVVLAPALRGFCAAYLGRRVSIGVIPFEKADPGQAREAHYWLAVAALLSGHATTALEEARAGLALLGHVTNDELRWRLATVGAAAARQLGTIDRAAEFTAAADAATGRLRTAWPTDFGSYERRPDLADLTRRTRMR